jgi:hypothetical protein
MQNNMGSARNGYLNFNLKIMLINNWSWNFKCYIMVHYEHLCGLCETFFMSVIKKLGACIAWRSLALGSSMGH